MSLRKKSATDGYGPTVSLGVTVQAAFVPVVVVVVVVVVVGLVGESPHAKAIAAPAAPIAPIASRRPIFLVLMVHK
jgi:hypothetical protein